MTDRFAGFVVTLDQPMRDDDSADIRRAIEMVRGVSSVEPVPADGEYHVAYTRAWHELREKLSAAFIGLKP